MSLTIPAISPARAVTADIVATPAYRWSADSIIQGPYKAYADGPFRIVSDYAAEPGYHMPIDKVWERKNDLAAYPRLTTPNMLHTAIFNMGLDEMVNAVERDSTLRTGREWPGVWTRDVSYSIILAMAALQPEVSRISLDDQHDVLRKVSKERTVSVYSFTQEMLKHLLFAGGHH